MRETPLHLFTGPKPPMPVIVDDPTISTVFGLGQSHLLGGTDLDPAWLIGEALNRHRAAIASASGFRAVDLTDEDGAPLSISMREVRLTGLSDAFCEGDTVALDLTVAPTAENGWRSVTSLRSHSAGTVRVEAISEMRPSLPLRRSRSRRSSQPDAPQSVRLTKSLHFTADGLLSLCALSRMAQRFEAELLGKRGEDLVIAARDIRVMGQPAPGTVLRLSGQVEVDPRGARASTTLIGEDCGAPVAAVETRRLFSSF